MVNNLDLVKNQKSNNDLIIYETSTGRSTIDHIFMHFSLIPDLINQVVEKVDNDLSDHAVVYATISVTFINPSFIQRIAIKKLVYRYDELSDDDWSAFGISVDQQCKRFPIEINYRRCHQIPNKYTSYHNQDLRP
ncbi:14122_t:CDS:2, partial [Funneliformis caledonium]